MFQMDPSDNAWRIEHDNSAKWDPRNRAKTRSPEEAERVLRLTGRIPRPLRLSDVKRGAPPLRKTIVATAKERRAAAEMCGIYAVSKLQARLLLNRETHPVWGHERVMVYGKMISEFMVPDVYANDPIEMSVPLKFRAAFREDADPYHPTGDAALNKELERRGLKSEIREGKVFEEMLRRQGDAKMDVAENMFTEAILDNVVDLGELVLQFYALYVDRQPVNGDVDNSKAPRRLRKRMNKDYGLDASFDMKDELIASKDKPSAQAIQDFAGSLSAMQTLSPRFKFKRN